MTQAAHARRGDTTAIKILLGLAIMAALTAATAGVILLIAPPEPGTAAEATLGFTAAAAGISTAVFAGAAAIYAQVRSLWQYAPRWVRIGAWAVLLIAVVSSIWGSITG